MRRTTKHAKLILDVDHRWGPATVQAPGAELLTAPAAHLSVNIVRVIINRSAVPRSRLVIRMGWELAFAIEVHDEHMRPEVVKTILEAAGRSVGMVITGLATDGLCCWRLRHMISVAPCCLSCTFYKDPEACW